MFQTVLITFLLFLSPAAWAGDSIFTRQTFRGSFTPQDKKVRVAIFDADQTLRLSTTKYRAPRHPSEVLMLPRVKEKILNLNREGFLVAIISNQENPVKDTGLELISLTMQETVRQLEADGAQINYVDFAVVETEAKPETTMFERLEKNIQEKFGADLSIDRKSSFMVGDAAYLADELRPNGTYGIDTANYDRKFAEKNGISFFEPQELFGWEKNGISRFNNRLDLSEYTEREARKNLANCPEWYHLLMP